MNLTPPQIEQLRSFRRAAREVREASIIARGQRIVVDARPDGPGRMALYVALLDNEPFRSLAVAVRLAYQQREPANFSSVCNVLRRHSSSAAAERVDALRAQWRDALTDPSGRVAVDLETGTVVFDAKEAFEHWLYGMAFHQDPERQAAVAQLRTAGARFACSVQSTSLLLAGRILDLDDVVADFLGEEQLPRI